MKFTKMQGLGNDYIYFNCINHPIEDPERLSIQLSKPHFGVGADGIVLILPSKTADFRMRMFNADGSEGKMCGNASRCIGKYVYERGLTQKTDLTLETLSGVKHLHLQVKDGIVDTVTVDMGKPIVEELGAVLTVNGISYRYTSVSMGNPHCVIFRTSIDSMDIETPGRKIEVHPNFPDRTNVEFVEIVDRTHIKMRVWERGSGETLACGTGACASVTAAVVNGLCDPTVTVQLRGGQLTIQYDEEHLLMTGSAQFVFDGEIKEEQKYA
ncbi:MAG: diaminopimelate epimerase [Massiliimalia sp.]|jgi:diaminopimelate epimerase